MATAMTVARRATERLTILALLQRVTAKSDGQHAASVEGQGALCGQACPQWDQGLAFRPDWRTAGAAAGSGTGCGFIPWRPFELPGTQCRRGC